jgi:hypothetical protein
LLAYDNQKATYNYSSEVGDEENDSKIYTLLRSHSKERTLIIAFHNMSFLGSHD